MTDEVETIVEKLHSYAGSLYVVKYGGSFMDAPNQGGPAVGVPADIAALWRAGIRVVVVHGGGKAVSRALEALGEEVRFVDGYRYTSPRAVEVVDRVLSCEITPSIVRAINEAARQQAAVLVPGPSVLTARRLTVDAHGSPADFGCVGEISQVDVKEINALLVAGKIPVISPTVSEASSKAILNCNADVAAAAVARHLGADRLAFMSDVPGLLRTINDPASLIRTLEIADIQRLKLDGTITGGMIPKIDSAAEALKAGVGVVHLIDGREPHAVLRVVVEPIGTMVIAAAVNKDG